MNTEKRPSVVTTAILLLWIKWAIVCLSLILQEYAILPKLLPVSLYHSLIPLIINALLYWYITQEKNWARIAFCALTIFAYATCFASLILALHVAPKALTPPLAQSIHIYQGLLNSPALLTFAIINLVLVFSALILLFTKTSSQWFTKKKT
jgi:hypothetical protein